MLPRYQSWRRSERTMKKIDLHIHTVATDRDSDFTFCMPTLREYVQKAKLDAIAITNHNTFDAAQFRAIKESVPIVVFPGIEIDLDDGHILLISDGKNVERLQIQVQRGPHLSGRRQDYRTSSEGDLRQSTETICLSHTMTKIHQFGAKR